MREYFCAYHSMKGAMRKLSDAECGRLFRALLTYSSGEQPDNLQGREELLFDVFAQQIDRDAERYKSMCETNKSNASGRNRSQANASGRNRSQANASDGNQEKEKEEEKEKDDIPPTPRKGDPDDDELYRISETINAAFDAAEGIGLKGSKAIEHANRLAADYSPQWLLEAINRTALAPKDAWCWRYIEGILRSWKKAGGVDQQEQPKPKTRKEKYCVVVNGEIIEREREVPV